jgi:DNA-binding NarL/FixJ family response regulator
MRSSAGDWTWCSTANLDLRVLILSMHENEQFLYEELKAGASGNVLKSAGDRDLVEACYAAMRGEPLLLSRRHHSADPRLPRSGP